MATILVVDARPNDRKDLVTILRRASHQVQEADNGNEAFAALRVGVPELLVIDNPLPPTVELLELVHSVGAWWETRNTPVILFTGALDQNKTRDLVSQCSGATAFHKPSEPELVLQIIDQVLLSRSPQEVRLLGNGPSCAHLESVTTQLYKKVTDLERVNADLIALNAALDETVSRLRAALAKKTVLLKEVHHRVKNNLAVIAGLLNMQAEESGNEVAETALQLSQQRVRSIALIHEQLYGSEHLDRVNFAEFAQQLTEELYRTFVANPELVRIRVEAEPIELDMEQAIPCGLILNELLLNAFKYAFIEGRSGELVVELHPNESGILVLSVQDDGIGLPPEIDWPITGSLGLEIVHILTEQLGGTLKVERDPGTRFELRIELPRMKGIPTVNGVSGHSFLTTDSRGCNP